MDFQNGEFDYIVDTILNNFNPNEPRKHKWPRDGFDIDPAIVKSTDFWKIERFSETIESFNYKDCPGHPTWLEQEEWLGSSLTKHYPLQLISGQPHNRLHSQLDNGSESLKDKISGREPVKIHPQDANARKLKDNDIVKSEVFFNKETKKLHNKPTLALFYTINYIAYKSLFNYKKIRIHIL